MQSNTLVVDKPLEKQALLRQLDLPEDLLCQGARGGLSGRAACTANHPPTYAGMRQWGETVKSLRDLFIPRGWRKSDRRNFSTLIREDEKIALVVARGDGFTGNPDPAVKPKTKYAKGSTTRTAVKSNGWLPLDQEFSSRNRVPTVVEADVAEPSTWVLLHSIIDDKLELELSHPISINAEGYVDDWDIRIVLESITLDPQRMPVLDDEPVEPDVKVTRRGRTA